MIHDSLLVMAISLRKNGMDETIVECDHSDILQLGIKIDHSSS
jgi:hypothetical protein